MRRRTNYLVASALILLLLGVAFVSPSAHAVTYSSDIGISFTFNTTLKVSLSNADLIINNLIPGTVSDSNIITVNAGTNNATGLTMNATVGNSTDYNNRNLTHTSDTITSNFSSVDFGSSLPNLTTDNTWGYSYSTDNQSTWSAYSGLPLYSDTVNIATLLSTSGRSTSATGDAVNFKIAAKASATQDSGEYRNVINFATVANPEVTGLLAISTMQQMTPDICTASAIGDEKQLIDSRDNKSYWVAKLADGKCWMTQNLDLDLSTEVALDSNASDISEGRTWTPENSTQTTAGIAWAQNGSDGARSFDSGEKYFANGIGSGTADANSNYIAQDTGDPHYSLGNYYNWVAATAGTGVSTMTSGTPSDSICPKGWRLPTASTDSDYSNLLSAYNINSDAAGGAAASNSPLYIVRAGAYRFTDGAIYMQGTANASFSSTIHSNASASLLQTSATYATAFGNGSRGQGLSVRCVARGTDLTSISTMQQMTPDICTATTVGAEKQLRDTRDNKTYWVAKLADGKCWMTQNLDLDLSTSKALTPSDSDVTSNWTPVRGTIDASAVTNNSISGWADDYNTPYSVDPGNWYWNALPFYSSTDNNFLDGSGGTKFRKNIPYANNGEHGHVGNYYNWSATVAMNSTSGYGYNNNPQTSICPKGWRLPTITTEGSTNEFGRLNQLYNSGSTSTSQNLEAAPLYFVRSGYVLSSQQYSAGNNGNYWSSSVDSSSGAYDLYFSSSYVNPTNDLSRYDGFSVRCVAR